MTPKPILKLGFGFAALALFCAIGEALFFGGVGKDGVLRQSLLLPLTFIFAAMAITAFVFALLRVFLK